MKHRVIEKFIFLVLNKSVGKGIRLIQRMLIRYSQDDFTPSLIGEVKKSAVIDSASYALENLHSALMFETREKLWDYLLTQIPNDPGNILLEFGVYQGESLSYFAKNGNFNEIYGFDSFLGLQEDWAGYLDPKGTFNLNKIKPIVGEGVELIEGWFEETLPSFLETRLKKRSIHFIHIDVDTYTPAIFILKTLSKNIGPGTIVLFDEYFGYPNWRNHEFRAFQEFIDWSNYDFQFLGYSETQVAILFRNGH